MKNFRSFYIILIFSMLLGCSSFDNGAKYGYHKATLANLGADINNLDFSNFGSNLQNDLNYKNILVKFSMLVIYSETYPAQLKELQDEDINNLCLSSIFIKNYKPLDMKLSENYVEQSKALVSILPELLNEMKKRKLDKLKNSCLKYY